MGDELQVNGQQTTTIQTNTTTNATVNGAANTTELINPQLESWNLIRNYHTTAKIQTAQGVKYSDQDGDIFAMRDRLASDEDSKSESYNEMLNAVNNLLNLSATQGHYKDNNGQNMTADFFDTFFVAKSAVRHYIHTHSGYRFTEKGQRRFQSALRINQILDAIEKDVKQIRSSLSEADQRAIEYNMAGLSEEGIIIREDMHTLNDAAKDVLQVAISGEYGPKMAVEAAKTSRDKWLMGNYTDCLIDMLKGVDASELKENRDDFIAYLEDRNNRLLANKVALTIITDTAKDATLDIPWLKEDLQKYVSENLLDSEWEADVDKFASRVKEISVEYYNKYKDNIQKTRERRDRIITSLHMPKGYQTLYDFPQIKQMIMFDNEEDFNEQLGVLKTRMVENDTFLQGVISEKYSVATQSSIGRALVRNLGALRVLGTREQLTDQTHLFLDMLIYTSPEDYMKERMLENIMKSCDIESSRLDSFIKYITGGNYNDLLKFSSDKFITEGEVYSKRVKANTKSYEKRVKEKNLALTREQWDMLEKMNLESGLIENDRFKGRIETFLEKCKAKNKADAQAAQQSAQTGNQQAANSQSSQAVNQQTGQTAAQQSSRAVNQQTGQTVAQQSSKAASQQASQTAAAQSQQSPAQVTERPRLITRKSYLEQKSFEKEDATLARVKRADAETRIIESYGDNLSARFTLSLKNGLPQYDTMERFAAAYTGRGAAFKDREKEKKRLRRLRSKDVSQALTELGITGAERDKCFERIRPLAESIAETTDEMHTDERLKAERINLENFGVRTWEDALQRIKDEGIDIILGHDSEQAKETEKRFEEGKKELNEYADGKYSEISDILLLIPSVNAAMMKGQDFFNEYLRTTLDKRLENYMSGLADITKEGASKGKNRSFYIVPKGICRQYAYTYLRDIYNQTLKGDAQFFTKQINDFNNKIYDVRPDGMNSISKNINDALKEAEKILKKNNASRAHSMRIAAQLYKMVIDFESPTDSELRLPERETMMEYARKEAEFAILKEKSDADKDKVLEEIRKTYQSEETEDGFAVLDGEKLKKEEKETEAREYMKKQKMLGRQERYRLLGVNNGYTGKVREGKSLIRIRGRESDLVSLKKDRIKTMKEVIRVHLSEMELPPEFTDALVEEGASDSMFKNLNTTMWHTSRLYKHAASMNKMYDLLRTSSEDETAMSDEEAKMYIVSCYGRMDLRSTMFEKTGGPNISVIRKTDSYKSFRQTFRALKEFEETECSEHSIKREKAEMSINLRTLFLTGDGLMKEDGKASKLKATSNSSYLAFNEELRKTIATNKKYLDYSNKVTALIRQELTDHFREADKEGGPATSEVYIDRQVYAVREYFLKDLADAVKSGDEFDESAWRVRVGGFVDDPIYRNNVEFTSNYVSNKTYRENESRRFGSAYDEKFLAEQIKNSAMVFKGRSNKFEQLDEDEKKLFAVGLMFLDRGSLSKRLAGSATLLSKEEYKKEELDSVRAEIEKYVSGREFHINVDYKAAVYNLFDYGENGFLRLEQHVLSGDAFDRAMQFARTISANRKMYGQKDVKRLSDGYSSINTAYVKYGKKQQLEVDSMAEEHMSIESVKDKLLNYAKADIKATTGKIKKNWKRYGYLIAYEGIKDLQRYDTYKRMKKIEKRITDMGESDLKVLVRLLQERTVVDRSTINTGTSYPLYADQEKHIALYEALSGDAVTRSAVLNGFDDDEACHQAMTTALSFKLKDDLNFLGKDLSKEHYVSGSFKRKTLVDWKLIEDTFTFMDEIKEKQARTHVFANSDKYIEQSHNEKARSLYKELKEKYEDDKSKYKQNTFEKMLKTQADKDEKSMADKALAGYYSLTDNERNLFIKVLSRRDYLDISKRDYIQSFFGYRDRNFVNAAGRNQLLDEYIETNMQSNLGIQLTEDAYYKAMSNLLSTQISDRYKLSKQKDLKKLFANERRFFYERDTAIDWKLFVRALGFVKRASRELEYTEGNAILYRGAGELSKHGRLSMDYSFLRRNFHRTGNEWGRYLVRSGVNAVNEEYHVDKYVKYLKEGAKVLNNTLIKPFGFDEDANVRKGVLWLKNNTELLYNEVGQMVKTPSIYDINMVELENKKQTEEQKEKAKEAEAKRRENLTFLQEIKEGIDGIIAQSRSAYDAFGDVAEYIRKNYATRYENSKFLKQTFDTTGLLPANIPKEVVQKIIDSSPAAQQDTDQPLSDPEAIALQKAMQTATLKSQTQYTGPYQTTAGQVTSQYTGSYQTANNQQTAQNTYIPNANDYQGVDQDIVLNIPKGYVEKVTLGAAVDKKKGDIRDDYNKGMKIKKTFTDVWGVVDSIPYVKEMTKLAKYSSEKLAYKFLNDQLIHADTDELLKDNAKATELDKLKRAADEYASDMLESLAKSAFGEEYTQKVIELEKKYYGAKPFVQNRLQEASKGIAYVKRSIENVKGIADDISNINLLKYGSKKAKENRAADDEKLEKAKETRLNEKEEKKLDNIVDLHRSLGDLSKDITDEIKKVGIASRVINLTIDTTNIIGEKLGADKKLMSRAIKSGLEFALFAIRVMMDRSALADYYTKTKAGQAEVRKLKKGFRKAEKERYLQNFEKKLNPNDLVRTIATASGYEHVSELVEDTGMNMAQSLVFCASEYNPMVETKLMAITVMSVLGMDKEIGSTSPATVKRLFEAFKMAR
ncbi:MAG: hypothetical protein K6E91_00595 [Butyrivibrio sp.]|nr:hypothetical protein [Butyrivibrio sp.]